MISSLGSWHVLKPPGAVSRECTGTTTGIGELTLVVRLLLNPTRCVTSLRLTQALSRDRKITMELRKPRLLLGLSKQGILTSTISIPSGGRLVNVVHF
ncbi:hypothetical protein D3C84_148240 [compost metagenome]